MGNCTVKIRNFVAEEIFPVSSPRYVSVLLFRQFERKYILPDKASNELGRFHFEASWSNLGESGRAESITDRML